MKIWKGPHFQKNYDKIYDVKFPVKKMYDLR